MKFLKFKLKKWLCKQMKFNKMFNTKCFYNKNKKLLKNPREWIMKKQLLYCRSFSRIKASKEEKKNFMIKVMESSQIENTIIINIKNAWK